MNPIHLLQRYSLNLVTAVTHRVYFCFDLIPTIHNNLKNKEIRTTKALSEFFYLNMIRLFQQQYDSSVFQALLWTQQAPDFVQVRANNFMNKIFKKDPLGKISKKITTKPIQKKLDKMADYDLNWKYFSAEIEQLSKDAFKIIHKRNYSNSVLQHLPISLYAIRHLIDDSDPDNYTATWPLELWVHRLPDKSKTKFKTFVEKVYHNNETEYLESLRRDLNGGEIPHFIAKLFNIYAPKK